MPVSADLALSDNWKPDTCVAGKSNHKHVFAPLSSLTESRTGNTSSHATLDDAISRAVQSNVAVYPVGVGDTSIGDGVDKKSLSRLAAQTGGRFFVLKNEEDLYPVFSKIELELRSQFLLTYAPEAAEKAGYRQIRIEIANKDFEKRIRTLAYRNRYFYPGSDN